MSIVLPIMFFAVLMGLFVPRITRGWWLVLAAWIILILLYNFFKPTAVPISPGVGLIRRPYVLSSQQG